MKVRAITRGTYLLIQLYVFVTLDKSPNLNCSPTIVFDPNLFRNLAAIIFSQSKMTKVDPYASTG